MDTGALERGHNAGTAYDSIGRATAMEICGQEDCPDNQSSGTSTLKAAGPAHVSDSGSKEQDLASGGASGSGSGPVPRTGSGLASGSGSGSRPPTDLLAVVASSDTTALSVCVQQLCDDVEYFAMAQVCDL